MRLACLALLLSACAHLPHAGEKPTATVRSAEVGAMGSLVTGVVTVDVFNPNPIGLPLSRVDWQLQVGEQNAASGVVELSQTIPARASALVVTKIAMSPIDAGAVIAQVALGQRRYRIRGALHFSTSLGRISVPFEVEGEIG